MDLKKQYLLHREALENATSKVCTSAKFILGPEVKQFEKNFASYLGVKEAVGVASGTDALRLSCYALKIGPGDEVLVPANTFIATALGVYNLGGVPVPVDVYPESFLMDLAKAEKQLTDRTKAIIPVHLYGQSMNMDAISSFVKKHNLILIEDACQAHGAMWKGKRVGSFGVIGCFSFYPTKNLGAFGDGGLVATNDQRLADQLRLLRNYGSVKKHIHKVTGTNSRLDSLHAAVLNVKLNFLNDWNKNRFQAACRYADTLKDLKSIKVPNFDHDDILRHVFHLFVIQCDRRDELLAFLTERGIQCGIHYPVPIHLHQAFASLGFKKGNFPVSEMLADRILSLPMFPEITDEQIDSVVKVIKEFYG
ncbi:MAG: DegT/DnrJ/EryC1/StrS family aminotransferase [bacterium]